MTSDYSSRVLGVYLGHDLGACLLMNGEVAACIEEERLNRFKHGRSNDVAGLWPRFAGKFGYFPWASVCYCLDAAGLMLDDLDLIVVGDALWAAAAEDSVHSAIPVKDKSKVVFVKEPRGAVHHYHHALSAFMASPFQEACVLVVDADGNSNEDGYEAETGFHFTDRRGQHSLVFKNRYTDPCIPRSGIGWMYEQVTLLLGFAQPSIFLAEPGKTMGLSAYGAPRPEFEQSWIRYDGFKLDFSAFRQWLKDTGYAQRLLSYRDGLATSKGEPSQYAKDLAFKVQAELNGAMLHLAKELHRTTNSRNLCMSGGVALNSVANGFIAAQECFQNLFIIPAPHDGGQAIGLAYHGHLMLHSDFSYMSSPAKRKNQFNGFCEIKPLRHAYTGRAYSRNEYYELLVASQFPFTEFADDHSLAESAAEELERGRVIAWFQGSSEIGPRALGHRSILANPQTTRMRDYLNSQIKYREGFRPYAPSVLAEHAREVFETNQECPYMLMVHRVRPCWKGRVPAIVHADQTARIQTVDASVEPLYHKLISAFYCRTGVPLVLNTSFNVNGMPLVESPYDALHCLLLTPIDTLYMGRFRIEYPSLADLYASKAPSWDLSAMTDIGRSGVTLVCTRKDDRKGVDFRLTPEKLLFFQALDGKTSLQATYDRVFREGACTTLQDLLPDMRAMARHGALIFRCGDTHFGLPDPGIHWWQVQRAQAV